MAQIISKSLNVKILGVWAHWKLLSLVRLVGGWGLYETFSQIFCWIFGTFGKRDIYEAYNSSVAILSRVEMLAWVVQWPTSGLYGLYSTRLQDPSVEVDSSIENLTYRLSYSIVILNDLYKVEIKFTHLEWCLSLTLKIIDFFGLLFP